MILFIVRILRSAPLIAPFFGEAEPFRFGKHALKECYRKIEEIGGIFFLQGAIMCAIVSILSDALGQIKQVFGNQTVLHQPFDARPKVASLAPSKSGPRFFRQKWLSRQIDSKPEHCSGSVPIVDGDARSRLLKNTGDVWWRMFGGIARCPIHEANEAIGDEKPIQHPFKRFGMRRITSVAPIDFLLRDYENSRLTAPSADAERFKNSCPTVALADPNAGRDIKRHVVRGTARTSSYEFCHLNLELIGQESVGKLPRILPFFERVAA
jgi:hypothetical protein